MEKTKGIENHNTLKSKNIVEKSKKKAHFIKMRKYDSVSIFKKLHYIHFLMFFLWFLKKNEYRFQNKMKIAFNIDYGLRIALDKFADMRIISKVCKSWKSYTTWRIAAVNNKFANNSLILRLDNKRKNIKNLLSSSIYSGSKYDIYQRINPHNVRCVIYSGNGLLAANMYKINTINSCRPPFGTGNFIHNLKWKILAHLVKQCKEKVSKITHLQIEQSGYSGVIVFEYGRIYLFKKVQDDIEAVYEVIKEFKPKKQIMFLKYQHSCFYFAWRGNICETFDFEEINIVHGITF